MKGFLIEDFCIHEEKGKSSEALHGSAHSQECLARPFLHAGRPGKTNSFAFSPARINKSTMWSSSEAKGNWAAFCCNCGRALVRAGILLVPQVRGPALASLQAGNA